MTSTRDNSLTNHLRGLIQTDSLSHAYLFFGEAKSEMKQEALAIAKELESVDASVLPEGFTLIDAKIINASGKESLGIDAVREIKNFLWQRPIKSKKRTVIISDAEELTHEAQNATLKILEDAPATALIIFITTNPERLLSTVISRMQKVFIPASPGHRASKKLALNLRARELAVKFLSSSATLRYALSKEIAEEEKENSPNLTVAILNELIDILKEKSQNNAVFLKELLTRRRLMGEYSLNKRLQLAFLSNLWYNGRV